MSRGSHAGHIPLDRHGARFEPRYPGRHVHERTSTADGLRLVPLERLDHRRYRPRDGNVTPPWRKPAYHQPESGEP